MEKLKRHPWAPVWAGAGLGLLETVAMLTAKHPLGITGAFEHAAGLTAEAIAPEAMGVEDYKRERGATPKVDWELGVVVGVVLGSMLSSRLSGEPKPPAVPYTWQRGIGRSRLLRYAAAFAGGAVMMLGARIAEGCTSGHGMSGTMQFAVSSWLFTPIIFATGAVVSRALYGRQK